MKNFETLKGRFETNLPVRKKHFFQSRLLCAPILLEKAFGQLPKNTARRENIASKKIRGVNKKELGANIWSAAQFTIHKSQQKRPERPDLELTQIGRGNMSQFFKKNTKYEYKGERR